MDYAGVTTAILQNDHIYGNLAEDFAAAGKAYPGRFIGLAQVDEANAYTDEQLQILRDQVERLGMAGLYFTTAGLSVSGYKPLHDDPVYDPLWREVARLDLPLFWVQFGASPVGTYEDEMLCLERIVRAPSRPSPCVGARGTDGALRRRTMIGSRFRRSSPGSCARAGSTRKFSTPSRGAAGTTILTPRRRSSSVSCTTLRA